MPNILPAAGDFVTVKISDCFTQATIKTKTTSGDYEVILPGSEPEFRAVIKLDNYYWSASEGLTGSWIQRMVPANASSQKITRLARMETMVEPTPEAMDDDARIERIKKTPASLLGRSEILFLLRRLAEKDAEIAEVKAKIENIESDVLSGRALNRQLHKQIAALRTQVEWRPIAQPGWHPINEYHRDEDGWGENVLLFVPGGLRAPASDYRILTGRMEAEHWLYWDDTGAMSDIENEPSHFMSLPAPPPKGPTLFAD